LQYDAGKLLAAFEALPISDYHKLVGVVTVDIFLPIFTHVFGEAQQGGRWALVSLFQLHTEHGSAPAASATIYERAAKIALHEIGHLFNLPHCDDDQCLMHFSGGLADLDRLPFNYCRYCRTFFTEALNADG
jgi:archaemetzincin